MGSSKMQQQKIGKILSLNFCRHPDTKVTLWSERHVNATAKPSSVDEHVHPFMTTLYHVAKLRSAQTEF